MARPRLLIALVAGALLAGCTTPATPLPAPGRGEDPAVWRPDRQATYPLPR